ncbi:MAG: amidohydrolase family protein [Haliea sp.]|uniref:amidohydrolase family protein n=1 Tax=Marinobacter salarius TaxID=1420917 RepID=UPI0032F05904
MKASRGNAVGKWVSAFGLGVLLTTSAAADSLLFTNVHVVDVRTGSILKDRAVRVEGERITAITPTASAGEPDGAMVVEGNGGYLAPGLMDMHVHLQVREHATMNLLRGVTTVRNMWGNPETLAWKAAVEEGTLPGARIVTSGALVDGEPPIWEGSVVMTDPADADAFVLGQKRAGYDFVKVYSRLEPPIFKALLDAGQKYGMEISGHVAQDVPLLDAIAGGMRTSEHLIGVLHAIAADRSLANPGLSPYDERAKELVLKLGTGEVPSEGFIDQQRLQTVAASARSEGHWFVPTTRVMRNFSTSPVPHIEGSERFMGPMEKGLLPLIKDGTMGKTFFKLTDEHQKGEDVHQQLRRQAILALYEAGAPMLVGTDSLQAAAGMVTIDEMESLQALGIPNDAVLRAATLEPARYLGREGELGEVREGAIADLILLGSNPLKDLAALNELKGVVKAGVWYSGTEIGAKLDEMEAVFAAFTAEKEVHSE